MRKLRLLLPLLILFSGCTMSSELLRPEPSLQYEGEVFVYVEPFPHEAERLRFSVEGLSALKSDGSEYPLSLYHNELSIHTMKRQRSLASGHLPPGSYIGFSIKVRDASLKQEEGEADLLVPDEAVRLDFPFTITIQKAVVVMMSFRYGQSLRDGFNFVPSFSIYIPDIPLFSLTGYVTNRNSHSITVFDKKAGEAAAVIETGARPGGMVIDQDQRLAYVAISDEDTIEVIDITSGDVIKRMFLNNGDNPRELSLTPDGGTLLAVNSASNSVSIIDALTLIELERINVGNSPHSLVLDTTGRRAFVFNTLSDSISIIDVPNKSIAATISTETGPLRGEFNREGDRLYVFFERSPYFVALDPFTFTVVKRIFVGAVVSSLKVDTKTDYLYVGKKNQETVDVYDPFSLMPGDTIRAGGSVDYMTIDGEGNNLCMVVSEKKVLVIANLISKKINHEIDVGDGPFWVTMMGER